MLSGEERMAIEEFKKLKDYKHTYYGYTWFKVEVCADDEMKQNIDIILNLIEKQSKEIEHWKAGMKIVEKDKNNHIERLEKEIEEHIENKELINQTLGLEKKSNINKTLEKIIILNNYEDKIKAKIEEYKKQIEKMEKDDVGIGFTLGKEWSDLKAKVEFGQSLLEKE